MARVRYRSKHIIKITVFRERAFDSSQYCYCALSAV